MKKATKKAGAAKAGKKAKAGRAKSSSKKC
jgi:hypothetical protein